MVKLIQVQNNDWTYPKIILLTDFLLDSNRENKLLG